MPNDITYEVGLPSSGVVYPAHIADRLMVGVASNIRVQDNTGARVVHIDHNRWHDGSVLVGDALARTSWHLRTASPCRSIDVFPNRLVVQPGHEVLPQPPGHGARLYRRETGWVWRRPPVAVSGEFVEPGSFEHRPIGTLPVFCWRLRSDVIAFVSVFEPHQIVDHRAQSGDWVGVPIPEGDSPEIGFLKDLIRAAFPGLAHAYPLLGPGLYAIPVHAPPPDGRRRVVCAWQLIAPSSPLHAFNERLVAPYTETAFALSGGIYGTSPNRNNHRRLPVLALP